MPVIPQLTRVTDFSKLAYASPSNRANGAVVGASILIRKQQKRARALLKCAPTKRSFARPLRRQRFVYLCPAEIRSSTLGSGWRWNKKAKANKPQPLFLMVLNTPTPRRIVERPVLGVMCRAEVSCRDDFMSG